MNDLGDVLMSSDHTPDLAERLEAIADGGTAASTHSEDCWLYHDLCAIQRGAVAVRERDALQRRVEQLEAAISTHRMDLGRICDVDIALWAALEAVPVPEPRPDDDPVLPKPGRVVASYSLHRDEPPAERPERKRMVAGSMDWPEPIPPYPKPDPWEVAAGVTPPSTPKVCPRCGSADPARPYVDCRSRLFDPAPHPFHTQPSAPEEPNDD